MVLGVSPWIVHASHPYPAAGTVWLRPGHVALSDYITFFRVGNGQGQLENGGKRG